MLRFDWLGLGHAS